jgi:hypothetical protein
MGQGLKFKHIDSAPKIIRVEQSKDRKDQDHKPTLPHDIGHLVGSR